MLEHKLDSRGTYKLDKSGIYKSILALPDQVNVAWNEVKLVDLTLDQRKFEKIVVSGMGGSALGARIIKAWLVGRLKVPFEVVNDYHLPAYVDDKTWVILSSYSGSTEETLQTGEEAAVKGAKVSVICTGGALAELARNQGWPMYKYEATFNPGNMPRQALGYNCLGIVVLMKREGVLDMEDEEIEDTVTWLKLQQSKLVTEVKSKDNAAKRLADRLVGHAAILVGARHLAGAVYAIKNQLNENAKTFVEFHEIPELNHHLLEGLTYPRDLRKTLKVVLFESDLYESDIQKRMRLTEEVLTKQGYQTIRIKPEGKSEWQQVWETVQFGEFAGFYLAMLNNLDPAPIVWVDYFKKRMEEG